MTRRGFGAVLATAVAGAALLLWGMSDPAGAAARSSAPPLAPKESGAPAARVAPEGIVEAETPAAQRLAANEQEKPATPAETAAVAPAAPARPGLLQVDTDQPLSITADELEAIELPDGGRQLVFNRKVNVDQGGLSVRSNRLEAHYPPQASQPDRLVASGDVRVQQKARELSCARATYFPARERLECSGNAMLRDGANRVSGEVIEIEFAEDRIRVKGGARVNVAPEKKKEDAKRAPAAAPAVGAAP